MKKKKAAAKDSKTGLYLGGITIGLVFMITMNMLATLLPLNGITTAAISDSFKVFFVPAGYVFAIWGVIYLTQIALTWQLFSKRKTLAPQISKLFGWVVAGHIANALWLVFWHYQMIFFTLPLMLVLLISLIQQYRIIRAEVNDVVIQSATSIYLGWISVATIANVTDVLWAAGWNGSGIAPELWAALMIVIAGLLAGTIVLRERDYVYPIVITWSIIGIAVKFSTIIAITWSVGIAIVIIAISVGLKLFAKK